MTREYSMTRGARSMREHTAWRRSIGHRSFKVWLPSETTKALEAYAESNGLTLQSAIGVLISEQLSALRH